MLRALDSGEVRRIAENDSRTYDVPFVAATNVDLKAAVDAGEFRDDLYYRLNVHHVHLPPLRDRPGDVPLLVEHFLTRYGPGSGMTACSAAALDVLAGYSFPGNVRQLEHIIQRAVATARSASIEVGDLPEELLASAPAAPSCEGTVAAGRDRAERDMIIATLGRHGGEITAAARELQVSRTTMWRLMKKHGINA